MELHLTNLWQFNAPLPTCSLPNQHQMGLLGWGQAISHLQRLVLGKVAAFPLFETIDREPEIDGLSSQGQSPTELKGNIAFDNVHFSYPTAPTETVLRGRMLTQSHRYSLIMATSRAAKFT